MPIDPELLIKLSRNDPELTVLYIDGQSIAEEDKLFDEDIEELYFALQNNLHVHSIYFPYHSISDAGVTRLCELHRIKTLDLKYNQLTIAGYEHLSSQTHFTSLDLSGTRNLSPISAGNLARNPNLEHLSLNNVEINVLHARALSSSKSIRELNLYSHHLIPSGLNVLLTMKQLQILDISHDEHSVKEDFFNDAIVKQLASHPNLHTLILDGLSIQTKALKSIVANPKIKTLSLNNAEINNQHLALLAQSKTLSHLYIQSNPFEKEMLYSFLGNETLLYLEHNHKLSRLFEQHLSEHFATNQALRRFNTTREACLQFLHFYKTERADTLPLDIINHIGGFIIHPSLIRPISRLAAPQYAGFFYHKNDHAKTRHHSILEYGLLGILLSMSLWTTIDCIRGSQNHPMFMLALGCQLLSNLLLIELLTHLEDEIEQDPLMTEIEKIVRTQARL